MIDFTGRRPLEDEWAMVPVYAPAAAGWEACFDSVANDCCVVKEDDAGNNHDGVDVLSVQITMTDNDEHRLLAIFDSPYTNTAVTAFLVRFYNPIGADGDGDVDSMIEDADTSTIDFTGFELQVRCIDGLVGGSAPDPSTLTWTAWIAAGPPVNGTGYSHLKIVPALNSIKTGHDGLNQSLGGGQGNAIWVAPLGTTIYGLELRFKKPTALWATADTDDWTVKMNTTAAFMCYALLT